MWAQLVRSFVQLCLLVQFILHVACDKHVGQKYEQNDSKYKLEHSRVEQGQFKMTTTEKTTHDYQWQHLLVQES